MSDTVGLSIYDVPENLRTALVADAQARGISIHEAVVSALAEHFNVARTPPATRFVGGDAEKILANLPPKLHRRLRRRAAQVGGTNRGVALAALAEHYGLPPISTDRTPRGTRS